MRPTRGDSDTQCFRIPTGTDTPQINTHSPAHLEVWARLVGPAHGGEGEEAAGEPRVEHVRVLAASEGSGGRGSKWRPAHKPHSHLSSLSSSPRPPRLLQLNVRLRDAKGRRSLRARLRLCPRDDPVAAGRGVGARLPLDDDEVGGHAVAPPELPRDAPVLQRAERAVSPPPVPSLLSPHTHLRVVIPSRPLPALPPRPPTCELSSQWYHVALWWSGTSRSRPSRTAAAASAPIWRHDTYHCGLMSGSMMSPEREQTPRRILLSASPRDSPSSASRLQTASLASKRMRPANSPQPSVMRPSSVKTVMKGRPWRLLQRAQAARGVVATRARLVPLPSLLTRICSRWGRARA